MTACQLWVMDRAVYVTLKQRDQRQLIEDKRKAVNQVPMLAVLSQVGPPHLQTTNQSSNQSDNVYMTRRVSHNMSRLQHICLAATSTLVAAPVHEVHC